MASLSHEASTDISTEMVCLKFKKGTQQLELQITIPRASIVAKDPAGETMIGATLARWNFQESKTEDDAIIVELDPSAPSAMGERWDEAVVPTIGRFYSEVTDITAASPIEVEGQVELQSVVEAFDYFGIEIDPTHVRLTEADAAVQVRAALYLKALRSIPKAMEKVLYSFQKNPTQSKTFVQFRSADDQGYLAKQLGEELHRFGFGYEANTNAGAANIALSAQFGFLADHSEWVESQAFRERMTNLLEAHGFEAVWLRKHFEVSTFPQIESFRWTLTATVPARATAIQAQRKRRASEMNA